MISLKTEGNVFMSFEYETLFGLIRITGEAIFVHSIYNKVLNNGSFEKFMNYLEGSKKPIIILEVRNRKFWHHLRSTRNYQLYDGIVPGTNLTFNDCLIKKPKHHD